MVSVGEDVSIRRMNADDAEAVCDIYGKITKELVESDFKMLLEEHAEKEGPAICFVAEWDGKIVGFMITYILPFGFGIERSSAWIATMGVHPKYMGQGIGGKMAREILSHYKDRGISVIHTSVRWDSTDVLSFFKSLGFDRSELINLSKPL